MADTPLNPEGQLHQDQLAPGASFVRGPLWADFKRALASYAPPEPEPVDQPHVVAAKAFQVKAWRKAIETIERIPFETSVAVEPLIPKSILDPKD
jgi:hypothetical protein